MSIQAIDTEWLLWANGHHSPLMDSLMWQASQPLTWLPLYALLIGFLAYAYKGGKTLRSWLPFIAVLMAFAMAAGLADYITSGILKPLVERPRPTHNEALAEMLHIVRGYTGGHYGFPSSHAANTAAVSVLFALLASRKMPSGRAEKWADVLSVICIVGYLIPNCYSRMYLGVHYPLDILAGLLIGTLTAWLSFALFNFCLRKFAGTQKL